MPVLDTTALIDADRGSGVAELVQARFDAGEDVVVPIQVAIEYCAGRADPAGAMRALRESFELVACDEEIGLAAARLARAAHKAGIFPGWADVQIAATAKVLGMPVVTRNPRHFAALDVGVTTYES